MDSKIKQILLEVTSEIIEALKSENSIKLGEIFNKRTKIFDISQDSTLISLSLITYALKKLIERQKTNDYKNWKQIFSQIITSFNLLEMQFEKDDKRGYRRTLKRIITLVEKLDSELLMYFEEIMDKSKLKEGYKMFEQGFSLGRVSELIGVSRWELTNYIGKTNLIDQESGVDITKERIKIVKELFNIK